MTTKRAFVNRVIDFIDLHKGEADKKLVLEDVIENTSFRGSNLWILACAILIASIGLNVNSTAVVIGAMLISPLMGPIVGAGFALGTYDFDILKKSFKNLVVATFVGLVVSALYFWASPFKQSQPELLARTSPTIYDVLIAFFGGLVGVIAVTRVEKGNPIPGVAIATALMPPLCTAGYGLAMGSLKFFLGAIYLYSINCVFICIATFLMVKYLNYPASHKIDPLEEKRVKYGITGLIFVMIIPSIYFAYQLLLENQYKQRVETYIEREFTDKGYAIIYEKVSYAADPKTIELAFLTKKFTIPEILDLNQRLQYYDLSGTELRIRQDTTDIKKYISSELAYNKAELSEKDIVIANLQKEIASYKFDNEQILSETKVLFPGIQNLSLAYHLFNENTDSARTVAVMVYRSQDTLGSQDQTRLASWLKQKLRLDELEIYRQGGY